ncbi:hypothetical protein OBBRIDRAFT_808150 [Obba rivulosa]|uniref:Uncharacterized protein n=1 Tax=Obba rivulosa TaxID=1052685 RepID=A0A8E2DE87_9APHY|nr:hypothetical protein OBBRIDRAFT_808150 [Obba rivulosa]
MYDDLSYRKSEHSSQHTQHTSQCVRPHLKHSTVPRWVSWTPLVFLMQPYREMNAYAVSVWLRRRSLRTRFGVLWRHMPRRPACCVLGKVDAGWPRLRCAAHNPVYAITLLTARPSLHGLEAKLAYDTLKCTALPVFQRGTRPGNIPPPPDVRKLIAM